MEEVVPGSSAGRFILEEAVPDGEEITLGT